VAKTIKIVVGEREAEDFLRGDYKKMLGKLGSAVASAYSSTDGAELDRAFEVVREALKKHEREFKLWREKRDSLEKDSQRIYNKMNRHYKQRTELLRTIAATALKEAGIDGVVVDETYAELVPARLAKMRVYPRRRYVRNLENLLYWR